MNNPYGSAYGPGASQTGNLANPMRQPPLLAPNRNQDFYQNQQFHEQNQYQNPQDQYLNYVNQKKVAYDQNLLTLNQKMSQLQILQSSIVGTSDFILSQTRTYQEYLNQNSPILNVNHEFNAQIKNFVLDNYLLNAAKIVEIWANFIKKVGTKRKIVYIYLANDLIQKSKKQDQGFQTRPENNLHHQFELILQKTLSEVFSAISHPDHMSTLMKQAQSAKNENIEKIQSIHKQIKETQKVVDVWISKEMYPAQNLQMINQELQAANLKVQEFIDAQKTIDLGFEERQKSLEFKDLKIDQSQVVNIKQKWLVLSKFLTQIEKTKTDIIEAKYSIQDYESKLIQILDEALDSKTKNEQIYTRIFNLKEKIESKKSDIEQMKILQKKLQEKVLNSSTIQEISQLENQNLREMMNLNKIDQMINQIQ